MSVPTLTVDGQNYRLGRIAPDAMADIGPYRYILKPDGTQVKVPRLSQFMEHARLKAAPATQVDYSAKAMSSLRRMYKNDALGICCVAMTDHQIGVMTANDATEVQASDTEAVADYHHVCGPGDNGCIVVDIMQAWQSQGYMLNGKRHKIDGYVAVDWTNRNLFQTAVQLFGTVSLAAMLPSGWTTTNTVWDDRSGGQVGGHCFPALGYGADLADANGKKFGQDGVLISTWAGLVLITWAAFLSRRWLEEAYVPLSPDWYNDDQLTPGGVSVQRLHEALDKIKNGQVPDIDPAIIMWGNV
jgi:hypothetical protein